MRKREICSLWVLFFQPLFLLFPVVPTALDPGIVDITSTDLIEFGIAGTSLSASDVVVVLSDITQSCSSPGDIAGGIVTESTLSFDGTKLRVQIQPGNPVSSTNKVCLQVRGEGNFFEIGSNSLVGGSFVFSTRSCSPLLWCFRSPPDPVNYALKLHCCGGQYTL